jgi:hypothetical protein
MACRGCVRLLRWRMPRLPWRSCGVVRLAGTLWRIATMLVADVLHGDGLQPGPRELEHGERFGHVFGTLRNTAFVRGAAGQTKRRLEHSSSWCCV